MQSYDSAGEGGGVIECEKERQTLFIKRVKYKDAG